MKRRPRTVVVAAASFDQMGFAARVERVVSTRVSLKYAGWLPAGRTFESELTSGSRVERHQLCHNVIAHS